MKYGTRTGESYSLFRLCDFVVFNVVFDFAEDGMLGPDLVLVDAHILLVWYVELLVLAREDRDFFWLVSLSVLAVLALDCWDAILDLVLKVVVSLAELVLLTSLIIDLD